MSVSKSCGSLSPFDRYFTVSRRTVSDLNMAMKYLAAYLMAVVAEDSHPSKAKIEAILKSIGADIDQEVLAAFLAKVEGKNAHELIAAGLGKLSSFAAAAPAASGAAASPSKKAAASPKAAAKKEEVC
jgi:large subunit ribosomal protein LP2